MIVATRVAPLHPPGNVVYVLLPGLGLSGRYLTRLAAALAVDAEVWIADFRLLKDNPPGAKWTVTSIARGVGEWMKMTGAGPAVLVGHSFGAQVAVGMALQMPELIDSVVLISPTVDPAARTFWRQFGRLVRDAPLESPVLLAIAGFDYVRNLRHVTQAVRAALAQDMEQALPRVTVPALVMRGARDPVVPDKWTLQVTRLVPGARLVTIPRAAHGVVYTAFKEVADAVRTFAINKPPPISERSP